MYYKYWTKAYFMVTYIIFIVYYDVSLEQKYSSG